MGWWLAFAIFLYFVCAVLILAEIFVPSGGVLGVCALICLIGGVAIFFRHSIVAGWVGIGAAIVMIPSTIAVAYKIFPKTRFGKSVTLAPPERQQGDAIPDTPQLKGLVGNVGVVLTPLRPVGTCDFSGQRVECVAESRYVDRGEKVTVIAVESTKVTVRVTEET